MDGKSRIRVNCFSVPVRSRRRYIRLASVVTALVSEAS